MIASATRIIRENPNIQEFTLQYTQERWPTPTGGKLKQMGTYRTQYDEFGNPVAVHAFERKAKTFGHEVTRRFVHNLAAKLPLSSPGWDTRSPRSSVSSDTRSWRRRSSPTSSFLVLPAYAS